MQAKPKFKKSMEDEFWDNYRPPSYLRNKYVWVASAVLSVALAIYSSTHSQL